MNTGNEDAFKTYLKWFERPEVPFKSWKFTEQGVSEIKDVLGNFEGFTINTVNKDEKPRHSKENQKDENQVFQSSLLDEYLQNISENEAKFPDTPESKLIFNAIDQTLENTVKELEKSYKLFHCCKIVRVGSSVEGLKIGPPNEFDYSIILPKLAEFVELKHSLHNNSINCNINTTFFRNLPDVGNAEEDSTFFYIQNLELFEDIASNKDLAKKLKEEIDYIGLLYEKALVIDNEFEGWGETLAPMISMPQRSNFELIFKALDKVIEECISRNLMPGLSILPKNQMRKFRSCNKPAITTKLLWQGKEFTNFEVDVDIALLFPVKKKPLFYNFPLYLKATQESNLPTMIPLDNSEEAYIYIIQSYKSCSLSYGIAEARLFNKRPSQSIIHKCIRVCKTLRNLFMTHYFDLTSETLRPVLKTYWIKTVAMYVFRKYLFVEKEYSDLEKKTKSDLLGKYVIQVFKLLYKCLTGDGGEQIPFMASFGVPFKNLLQSKPKLDEEMTDTPYLDEDQIQILCRSHIVAANDINHLLQVLERMKINDRNTEREIERMVKDNAGANNSIYKDGMREKLGLLLYQHFEIEEREARSSKDDPYFMEFIRNNYPLMEVIQLGEDDHNEIKYCHTSTVLPIRLLEDNEVVDLEDMFTKASNIINFWSLEAQNNMTSDYHRHDFN